MQNTPKIQTGKTYAITISKLVYQGWGLGDLDGFKIFVPGTLPGDQVEVVITKKKRTFAHAKRIKLISSSPSRQTSPCNHYPACGGCQFIDVHYETQLKIKHSILEDCIHQFLPHMEVAITPIIPAPNATFYRNKMEFSFATHNKKVYTGLKKRGRYHEVVHTSNCLLQSEQSNLIRERVETYFEKNPITTWDYHSHQGTLRHLMIRHSKTQDTYMLNFVVSEDCKDILTPLISQLIKEFPHITSVFMSVNNKDGDTAFTPSSTQLSGSPYIEENFNDIIFKISPQSFFQTNSIQGKVLYDTIVKLGNFKKTDLVFDLYCGTGTIGFYVAKHVKKVVGIEENPQAIEDAKENAKRNAISNVEFIADRVKNVLKTTLLKPDVIILDPPRSGTVPKALRRIIALDTQQIIYVSCNPVTLMRDLIEFKNNGYAITTFQPVDMFPNTFHVEVIVILKKSSPPLLNPDNHP